MLKTFAACLGGCLGVIMILLIIFGISWGLTCGIIFLITFCFGLPFDLLVATGIWLILVLLGNCFTSNKSSGK